MFKRSKKECVDTDFSHLEKKKLSSRKKKGSSKNRKGKRKNEKDDSEEISE